MGLLVRGRDRELATIGELVSATARGNGGVLLVEGPSGIGKTRMLAEAATIAGRTGVRHVSAEAFEGQRTVPFATLLTALFEGHLWGADRAERLRDAPELAFWLIEEIYEAIEVASLEGPLTIALDDLQCADAGTLLALRTLVPRTAELPVLWIFALRPGDARPELRELTARLDGARRLQLRPLSDAAVAEVVADRLTAAGEPSLLALAANAHGNPFLLVELLDGLREERRVRIVDGHARLRGDELPARLAESMRERLDRLSPETCQLVRVAAVLGHRFTADQLAAVLDRRPSQLLEPIEESLRTDLLREFGDRLGFRHEMLRQAVLRTLSRSVLRGLQREAAGVLLEHGAEPVQVATQLAESAEPGDEVAIEQLRRASQALAATDAGAAADLALRALELTPADHPERTALVGETMAALHAAMRDDEATALGTSVLDGTLSPDDEAEVRLRLSSQLMGRDLVAAEENRRALRIPGISPRLRAQHLGWLTCTLANAGFLAEAEEHAELALAAAAEAGDESARALALAGGVSCLLHRGRYQDALEAARAVESVAEAAGDPVVARLVEFQRADALAALGRTEDSIRLLHDGLERGRREQRAWLVSGWVANGAHLRYVAGGLADARADAEATESMGFPLTSHVGGAAALVSRFQVALHTGDRAQVRASAAAARRVVDEVSPAVRRNLCWMLALAAVQAGDPRAAVAWLADDELPYAAPSLPSDPAYHPQVVRIALAAGDERLAGRALAVAEAIEDANPGAPLLAGLAAHARGLLTRDAAELERAAGLLRRCARPLPLAAALEDAGEALGDVDLLNEALELYNAVGASADGARVAARLRTLGVRRRAARRRPAEGWDSLTDSELRVVRLVGQGATNRDAAARLYLSPHTVSSHLRHAFAKLRINSRVELARLLHEYDVPSLV